MEDKEGPVPPPPRIMLWLTAFPVQLGDGMRSFVIYYTLLTFFSVLYLAVQDCPLLRRAAVGLITDRVPDHTYIMVTPECGIDS